MFIVGGVLIARPGVLGSRAIEQGVETTGTLALSQVAGRSLVLGRVFATVLACVMKETHPKAQR